MPEIRPAFARLMGDAIKVREPLRDRISHPRLQMLKSGLKAIAPMPTRLGSLHGPSVRQSRARRLWVGSGH